MKRKLTALLISFSVLIGGLYPAYADQAAASVFDSVAALLTDTENVTLTGSATFSLDGDAFKYVETTYVQDGVNSKWVLNLSSPKADGTLRENGFTVIANNRLKYGMEVFVPGFYTIAEDDPQTVILRPSAALTQLTSLGHSILEQLPTLPDDIFSLSGDNQLIIRMEEKDIPDSLSSLISLGIWLAVQRTMNIVDDSIAAPPYPEEAGTMSDFITPTQAIINSTEMYELTQLSIDAKMDEKGRIMEANGTARFILHTFLEGEHELHISFAGKAMNYGTSTVAAFDPEEYGVEPAEGTYLPPKPEEESEAESYYPRNGDSGRPSGMENRNQVYWINPNGGTKYHLDQNCPSIHPRYLPLSVSVTLEDLMKDPYSQLSSCSVCVFPEEILNSSQSDQATLGSYTDQLASDSWDQGNHD